MCEIFILLFLFGCVISCALTVWYMTERMYRRYFDKIREMENEKIIGEVLCGNGGSFEWDLLPIHACRSTGVMKWVKFRLKDLKYESGHDNYLCILDKCHKRENVIFYDDIYQSMKSKIEKNFKIS